MDKRRRSSLIENRRISGAADCSLFVYSSIWSSLEESFEFAARSVLQNEEEIEGLQNANLNEIKEITAFFSKSHIQFKEQENISIINENVTYPLDEGEKEWSICYINELEQEEKKWKKLFTLLKKQCSNNKSNLLNVNDMPHLEIEAMSKKFKSILKKRQNMRDLQIYLKDEDLSLIGFVLLRYKTITKEIIDVNKQILNEKTKAMINHHIPNSNSVLLEIF